MNHAVCLNDDFIVIQTADDVSMSNVTTNI